ncbi:MAG: DUF4831 family protein, partial [Rikenellaceae bacterium]
KLLGLLFVWLIASTSNVGNAQSKIVETSDYILPQTAINVKFTVRTETIKKGPYAKFAQQYLGVTAPLNDKTTYTVASSDITGYNEAELSNIYVLGSKPMLAACEITEAKKERNISTSKQNKISTDVLFSDMGINNIVYSAATSLSGRSSAREKSLEEMAADVANSIFTLRKRRFDLITGELGEGVFGEGLAAAIKEMARIEDEYLSLFVGKKSVTYKTYNFDIVPQIGKNSYILARFSENSGVVESTDMNGEPVVLTIAPEGVVKPITDKRAASIKGTKKYRIADMATVKLFFSSELLNSQRIGILQYGATVEAK